VALKEALDDQLKNCYFKLDDQSWMSIQQEVVMILSFTIYNKNSKLLGAVRINLDWVRKTWSVEKDLFNIWYKISSFESGSFEIKSWGAIWIIDQERRLFMLYEPPKNASDLVRAHGAGYIFDSKDEFVRNTKFKWSVYSSIPTKTEPLSTIRQAVVSRLIHELENASAFGTKNYPGIAKPFGKASVGTNCYIMGSIVAQIVGEKKGIPVTELLNYVRRTNLNAIKEFRERSRRGNSWVNAFTSTSLPRPGDVFALLQQGVEFNEHNCETGLITHIGAIIEIKSPTSWQTADFGQTLNSGGVTGQDGMLSMRTYDAEAGTLTDDPPTRGKRVLAGWSDIDIHFSNLS
jgi:hypothetical protein